MTLETAAPGLAADLYAIDAELAQFTTERVTVLPPKHYEDLAAYPEGFKQIVEGVFDHANMVVQSYQPAMSEANLPFTRAVIEAAHHYNERNGSEIRTGVQLRGACLEAELALVRSLDYHNRTVQPPRNHRSAAVYFDVNGDPCGYAKAVGARTIYMWRDAELRITEGVCWVPGDCFVEAVYGQDNDPADYKGLGLISLQHSNKLPSQVRLVRFSTASLGNGDIAYHAAKAAAASVPSYREYVSRAALLRKENVAECISNLLRNNKAVAVR